MIIQIRYDKNEETLTIPTMINGQEIHGICDELSSTLDFKNNEKSHSNNSNQYVCIVGNNILNTIYLNKFFLSKKYWQKSYFIISNVDRVFVSNFDYELDPFSTFVNNPTNVATYFVSYFYSNHHRIYDEEMYIPYERFKIDSNLIKIYPPTANTITSVGNTTFTFLIKKNCIEIITLDRYLLNDQVVHSIKPANVAFIDDGYFSISNTEDGKVEKPKYNPIKPGCVFAGWYKEEESVNKWDFEKDRFTIESEYKENRLYAGWGRI